MSESLRGHAQVQLVKSDGTGAHRAVLGFWDEKWDAHRGEEWHSQLFGAFRNSMTALQRHQETITRAALNKAGNNPATPDPKVEARLLDRAMQILESFDLGKVEADITT